MAIEARHAVARPPGEGGSRPNAELTRIAGVFCLSALGALVIALSYSLARSHTGGALAVWWVGQLLMFGPVAVYAVFVRAPSRAATASIALILGLVPYVAKIFYSPLFLAFSDELQHWRGTANALGSHQLGGRNYSLPVAAGFPGLESVNATFASMTGLSIDVSAFIVAGFLKVALVVAITIMFAEITGSCRVALIGVLLYAANGNFAVFSSYFVYQNAALPFAVIAIYATLRSRGAAGHARLFSVAAYTCVILTIVSHHVIGVFLVATLCLIAAHALLMRDRQSIVCALPVALFSIFSIFAWFTFNVPSVYKYLRPYILFQSSTSTEPDIAAPIFRISPTLAPLPDRLVNRGGVGLLLLVVVCGLLLIARRRGSTSTWPRSWRFAMIAVALLLPVSAVLALGVPFGYQAATRGAVFTYIGTGVIGSVALVTLTALGRPRRLSVLASVVLIVCYAGGLEVGWPPWFNKLPGVYHPSGYETGLDTHVLNAARWVEKSVPTRSRFAADANGGVALATLANQSAQPNAAPVFYDTSITAIDRTILRRYGVRYIWIDSRIEQRSPSARYYSDAVGVQYTFPPPAAGLAKFGTIPGVKKIYSDGTIEIFDLAGTSFYG